MRAINLDVSPFIQFLLAGNRLFTVVSDDARVARSAVQVSGEGEISPMPFNAMQPAKEMEADIAKHAVNGVLILYGAGDDLLFLLMLTMNGLRLPEISRTTRTAPMNLALGMTVICIFVKDGTVYYEKV
ncbi:hypothetical protein KBD61_02275 [Patescibacteria group bacterium]|nr:hypothetical protein [Patescibacteria group bacterium]